MGHVVKEEGGENEKCTQEGFLDKRKAVQPDRRTVGRAEQPATVKGERAEGRDSETYKVLTVRTLRREDTWAP